MTINTVVEINQALIKLFQIDEKTPLNFSGEIRMSLALLAGKLSSTLVALEKTRIGLLNRFGTDPQGNVVPEKRNEFIIEIQKALDSEVSIDVKPLKAKPFTEEQKIPIQLLTILITLGVISE